MDNYIDLYEETINKEIKMSMRPDSSCFIEFWPHDQEYVSIPQGGYGNAIGTK
jgi:hypothetical protein